MRPLTENQIEVLSALLYSHDQANVRQKWCTPLDIGAGNGSHHSGTLNGLAKKGLVQFRQRYDTEDPPWGTNGKKAWRGRGSKEYRITPDGREALAKAGQEGGK